MRRKTFLLLSILGLSILSCRKDDENINLPEGWENIIIYNYEGEIDTENSYYFTGVTINQIEFTSANHVVAIGSKNNSYAGTSWFFVSNDAGLTWSGSHFGTCAESTGSSCFFVSELVGFATFQSGYCVSQGSLLYKTLDGGQTWMEIGPVSSYVNKYSIHFFNESIGIIGELKTVDGGISWQPMSVAISAISFIGNSTGFGLAGNKCFKTTDQGDSWIELIDFGVFSGVNKIHFLNEQEGFVGSSYYNSSLFRTIDGGMNWTLVDSNLVQDFYFVDDKIGFYISATDYINPSSTSIHKTTDGGATWNEILRTDFHGLRCISGWGDVVIAAGRNSDYGGSSTPLNYTINEEFILRSETLGE